MRLECPREKIVVMIGRKYRRQEKKKKKRLHNEVEIYVALTVMCNL